jgi:HYDIN/CFA65/VesB-like, Ig-like domain
MVTLNPTSLNFGDVPGGEKKTLTSTLTNTGTETLHFNGTTITGMDEGDFSESADCPRSLGAGDYCTIYVTFAPQGLEKRSADLLISDDAPGSPQRSAYPGYGELPNCSQYGCPKGGGGNCPPVLLRLQHVRAPPCLAKRLAA